MQRVRYDDLAWVEVPMPDGSGPIHVRRLPRLPDGHLRIFGRFPPNWVRTFSGHYPVFEEILLLEGDLRFGDESCVADGYTWVPARRLRARTASDGGCIAFARFGGVGRWVRGEAETPPSEPRIDVPDVRARSTMLHAGAAETSRIVMSAAEVRPHGGPAEWLSLADRTWVHTEAGEDAPDLPGPLFVRTLAPAA
jgi:hypothetical protein